MITSICAYVIRIRTEKKVNIGAVSVCMCGVGKGGEVQVCMLVPIS